jgi:hypothetical protein
LGLVALLTAKGALGSTGNLAPLDSGAPVRLFRAFSAAERLGRHYILYTKIFSKICIKLYRLNRIGNSNTNCDELLPETSVIRFENNLESVLAASLSSSLFGGTEGTADGDRRSCLHDGHVTLVCNHVIKFDRLKI